MYLHIVHMNLFQLTCHITRFFLGTKMRVTRGIGQLMRVSHNSIFSRNQNARYAGNRCVVYFCTMDGLFSIFENTNMHTTVNIRF